MNSNIKIKNNDQAKVVTIKTTAEKVYHNDIPLPSALDNMLTTKQSVRMLEVGTLRKFISDDKRDNMLLCDGSQYPAKSYPQLAEFYESNDDIDEVYGYCTDNDGYDIENPSTYASSFSIQTKGMYGNGLYVAITYSSNIIITSTDGINWTRTDIVVNNVTEMAFLNNIFIISSKLYMYVSTDGINWTTIDTPLAISRGYSLSYINNRFVAVHPTNILSSDDAFTWVEAEFNNPSSSDVNSCGNIIYGNDGWYCRNSNNYIYSTDGISWTQESPLSGTTPGSSQICYDGERFLAFQNNAIYTSPDFKAWTIHESNITDLIGTTNTNTANVFAFYHIDDLYIACVYDGSTTSGGRIFYSYDYTTWELISDNHGMCRCVIMGDAGIYVYGTAQKILEIPLKYLLQVPTISAPDYYYFIQSSVDKVNILDRIESGEKNE